MNTIKENITGKSKTGARPRSKYDSAWKTVIKKLFEDFLEFFYPEIHAAIDFSKEFTFLDKELNEILADSNLGDRVADVRNLIRCEGATIPGGEPDPVRIDRHRIDAGDDAAEVGHVTRPGRSAGLQQMHRVEHGELWAKHGGEIGDAPVQIEIVMKGLPSPQEPHEVLETEAHLRGGV